MYKFVITTLSLVIFVCQLAAQTKDSLVVSYGGYFDFYYTYDLNGPKNIARQPFLVSYNRHEQFRMNIASAYAQFSKQRFRAKIALQAGSFVKDNYVAESSKYLGAIQEANMGFPLNSEKTAWLDVGIMPSHIGYETSFGGDNFNLTRSLASELTPYYITGAKLSYKTDKYTFAGIIFNSWANIFDYKKGQLPSVGTQLIYAKSNTTTIYWNTFLGSASQQGFDQIRFYNNIYALWQPNKKDEFIAALDVGFQRMASPETGLKNWFSPSVVLRHKVNRDWSIGARGEMFFDEFGAVTQAVNGHAFDLLGGSANIDYRFTENGLLRLEGRLLSSSGLYFYNGNKQKLAGSSPFVTFSMTKRF